MNKKKTAFISMNPRHCVACWECVNVCPKQVIGKVHFLWHKHTVFKNSDVCIGCKKCINICAHQVFTYLEQQNEK